MTIYKGSYITNTGGWGGCRSHDVCYAKTEYGYLDNQTDEYIRAKYATLA